MAKHELIFPLSLEEWVIKMVNEGKTKTKEFEDVALWYGKERLRELYRRAKEKNKTDDGT